MARAQGALGQLVAELEEQPIPHPLVGLEDTYAISGRFLAAVKQLVEELDSPLGINRFDEQVVHPLVALFGEWVDRYTRVQKVTLDARLDERRAPLDAGEADAIRTIFVEAVAAAGLTPEQQEAIEQHVSTGLRSLAAS